MNLHLGCGRNIKEGYVNIDAYVDDPRVIKAEITDIPYPKNSADEILAEHVFEHLGFAEEERLFRECFRVLRIGGKLIVETPDMEWLCRAFLVAKDEFKEFYQVESIDHYFGNGRTTEQRWGMITTHFFGNQNGPGQFHRNGYTIGKFQAISKMIGFSTCDVTTLFNKGAQAIRATFVK